MSNIEVKITNAEYADHKDWFIKQAAENMDIIVKFVNLAYTLQKEVKRDVSLGFWLEESLDGRGYKVDIWVDQGLPYVELSTDEDDRVADIFSDELGNLWNKFDAELKAETA